MKSQRPYFIAELSANHMRDFHVAQQLVYAAKESGATAIKLQTFTADGITVRSKLIRNQIPQESPLWSGTDLWNLMKEAETPWEWQKDLIDLAHSLGMDAFSTPYSIEALDFLLNLGVDAVKISSFDVANLPLLREVAKVQVPVIQSTGMASMQELGEAAGILLGSVPDLIFLKCTSSYPCSSDHANLLGIKTIQDRFSVEVGFSDHTITDVAALIAVGLGATVFEKHLKLSADSQGLDSAFSASLTEFASYVNKIEDGYSCLGSSLIEKVEAESASYWERPSLVALRDISEGEVFDALNTGIRRPNIGLAPKELDRVIGQKSKSRLVKGQGITSEVIMRDS